MKLETKPAEAPGKTLTGWMRSGWEAFGRSEQIAAAWALKAQRTFCLSALLEREWLMLSLLFVWGLFVYYHHLGTALGEVEARYAEIARGIVRTQEWWKLRYDGLPYLDKPPLHFWMMALSVLLWGPNEFALRFPSASFGIATMVLAYCIGRVVFHRRIGLIAALITSTVFLMVWEAHRAKFDIELGFLMNLAFFAFYLAYRGGRRRFGYLCLAFIAMAVAAMLKGLVGVLLPGITALAYLLILRRSGVFKEIPFLLAGLALFLLPTGYYYWRSGEAFNRHFFVGENLMRILHGPDRLLLYFYMIFADFHPWSFFLPAMGLYFWTTRSRQMGEAELMLRVWGIGFFLLLSLPMFKAERFLVYLIPPFALLLARYWDHLFCDSEMLRSTEDRLLRLPAALLGLGTLLGLFVGPSLVQKRFNVHADFLPAPFVLLIGIACAAVCYAARKGRARALFSSVLAVAVAMTFGLVQYFYPTLDRYDSARTISKHVQMIVGNSPLLIYRPDHPMEEEILYYLNRPDPIPRLSTSEQVYAAFRSKRRVFGLLDQHRYEGLERRGDLPFVRVADYFYRRRGFVLVKSRAGW